MVTVVKGKKIENKYSVKTNTKEITEPDGSIKTVYTDKPELEVKPEIVGWEDICKFEGDPHYNYEWSPWNTGNYINISENEEVRVEKVVFRADLYELHLLVSKVISEKDIDKNDSEKMLEEHLEKFNKMMIESNDKMKSYCELHKLVLEDTDAIELFKLVHPDKYYEIVDGVIKDYEVKYTVNQGITLDPSDLVAPFTISSIR